MFAHNGMNLIPFQELNRMGEDLLQSQPDLFEETARAVKPSDPLSIIYTSGTTGDPKGALISHGKHLAAAYTLIERYPVLQDREHRTVVYLPLCHIIGKDIAITLPLLTRIVPHYGGHIEDLEATIFETAPTVLFAVPRYLQKFASRLLVGLQHSSPVKRFFYHAAMKIGRAHVRHVWAGERQPFLTFLYSLSRLSVFRPLLNKVGFSKCVLVICAGAPLSADLAAFWHIYGVNVSDLYGQTETGGAAIASQGAFYPKPGDVGIPPSGWSVRLAENGEIQVYGEDMFEGYWKHPELTSEVYSADGWLKTGDMGEWTPDGNLKITGRIRDTIVTSGGKTLSPTYIENALRSSHYISEAVVFGNGRNYITALIEIDFDTVSAWARINGVGYTGFADLCANTAVNNLISNEVDRANADLARVEQVKAFRIIPAELDPWHDGEPITPTRKVKRDVMYEKFRTLIESMYTEEVQELVASEVGDVLTGGQ
jgi:long-chain acyl-CoA synthetase